LTAELVVLAHFYVAHISRTIYLLVLLLSYFIFVKNMFKFRYCITSNFHIVTRTVVVDFEAVFHM